MGYGGRKDLVYFHFTLNGALQCHAHCQFMDEETDSLFHVLFPCSYGPGESSRGQIIQSLGIQNIVIQLSSKVTSQR